MYCGKKQIKKSLSLVSTHINNDTRHHSGQNLFFTITAEIHARSLANFYCQYADRQMNLKFMRRVSEREPAIRQFIIVKNKLMSVCGSTRLSPRGSTATLTM